MSAGQRVGRRSGVYKKLQSRVANGVRGAILRDGTRDSGCGLKVFRREAFLALPYFDAQHRFLPALFRRDGYSIGYVDVIDRPGACRQVELRAVGPALVGIREKICPACGGWFAAGRKCLRSRRFECSARFRNYLHEVFIMQFDAWVALGFLAQALFGMRFLVQWIASERAGRSIIPTAFWLFSIGGGVLLCAYSLYRRDPVFIAGQGLGLFIYLRNLYFVLRERGSGRDAGCLTHRREAALQVGGEVADILEPDMKSEAGPPGSHLVAVRKPSNRTGSQGFRIRPMRRRSRTA